MAQFARSSTPLLIDDSMTLIYLPQCAFRTFVVTKFFIHQHTAAEDYY